MAGACSCSPTPTCSPTRSSRTRWARRAAVILDRRRPLLDDSVKWLGGEEVFAGEVVSEDDKPIQHTKNQDAVWFTLTIVGMPLLVLALGLVGTWARRRGARRQCEVTP